jgi:cation/acetate symporter
MIYHASHLAVAVFVIFVAITLALSFYFAGRTKSAAGYFAAGGSIPWFINGIAFAGDYLSAASFLGICGMIAFYGYDGFLYSIGYLAGWVVALFVIAEPLKRLGRYTFADALDSRFQSRWIKLAAGTSALVVSIIYLIPQMVGAGVLIKPLLGFEHWQGVLIVGAVVVLIVVTAGMVSTTYVQFLKGSLLVVFSTLLTALILHRGLSTGGTATGGAADSGAAGDTATAARQPRVVVVDDPALTGAALKQALGAPDAELLAAEGAWKDKPYVRLLDSATGGLAVWRMERTGTQATYRETQVSTMKNGQKYVGGLKQGTGPGETDFYPVGAISHLPDGQASTGPLGPFEFFSVLERSEIVLWGKEVVADPAGATTVYYPKPAAGSDVLLPGGSPTFAGLRSDSLLAKLNFLSLMLALFGGTASLPHILIRYYTVKDQAAARKSTVVGIASIGCFYVLTLYMGLGAMTSGAIDVTDNNMAAPLLARSFGQLLFALISAIAFTTVLGTVSGLIVAASGAVVHDLLGGFLRVSLSDEAKVRVGRIAAVAVGCAAIVLGILFANMNVSFLVGWAFGVAASANLPALVMLLFWRGTTRQGITAAVIVGMVSSLAWVLTTAEAYRDVYGWPAESAPMPFSQPGIITIPLGFLTLVVVSLLTREKKVPGPNGTKLSR